MASEQTILNVMAQALWKPQPTSLDDNESAYNDKKAQYLAFALGYPPGWRVVRRTLKNVANTATKQEDAVKQEDEVKQEPAEQNKTESSTIESTQTESNNAESSKVKSEATEKNIDKLDESKIAKTDPINKVEDETNAATTIDTVENIEKTTENTDSRKAEPTETKSNRAEPSEVKSEVNDENVENPGVDESAILEIEFNNEAENVTEADTTSNAIVKVENTAEHTVKEEPKAEEVIKDDKMDIDANENDDSTDHKTITPVDTTDSIIIEDTIYAGHPDSGCDVYFHHEAAINAAYQCYKHEENEEKVVIKHAAPCFFNKGGHLLKRVAKFQQNDRVQVWYGNDWFDAKILRRKEHPDGFKYGVFYPVDSTKQSNIEERYIRYMEMPTDPVTLAKSMGFDNGEWKVYSRGNSNWKIVSPSGTAYTSKKTALKAYKESVSNASNSQQANQQSQSQQSAALEEGDPPWRTTGHEFLGRHILWTTQHAKSARRTVTIDQVGKVTGWISAVDVDQAGQPGYVSEKTNKPAALFHVDFEDVSVHPYAAHLVSAQDLEEDEIQACLIPDDELGPAKKKARKR